MSKFAARLYDRWFGDKSQKRSYAAARINRNNANWTTQPTGANYEHRMSLQALRARARQLSRDNGHIKKFLSLTRSNIIGQKGIQLECRARKADGKTPNTKLNQMVEDAWWQWGHAETCSVSGKLNWVALQKLVVTQLARDGEFLVQMISANNAFGFSLKVWDVNWLQETYNEIHAATGNRIIMSVEVDANDRPVAYWLTTPSSEITFSQSKLPQRFRIPADQMVHGFLVTDDESQVRGVTWFHAAALDAKNMQGYREGVIQSARMSANVFGFIEQEVGEGVPFTGDEDADGTPQAPVIDVSNLSVNMLNPGQKWSQMDPKQPTQNHSAFAKSILMDLASALDVPYFLLAGDMESVNFSSSRVGLDDARDIWRGLQDMVAASLCRPIFHAWLRSATLSGKIQFTNARDIVEVQNPGWRGRGWKYIDPTKDIAADVERLQNRLVTPSQIMAEQGEDYVDFLTRWKQDRELAMATAGIDIDEVYQPKQLGAAPPEPDAPGDTKEPPDEPAK